MSNINRWLRSDIDGSTFYKSVLGMYTTADKMYLGPVVVRITADKHGKTLSLSDDENIQISISLVDIEDKLMEAIYDH